MTEWQTNDAVIIDAVRSPFARARKGGLTEVRPDDLSAAVVEGLLSRVDGSRSVDFEDLIWGCAEPHDEHGQNIARRIAVLLGEDELPGTTVNRFCASSLQALRMAFHGIRSGEGRAYIVGGAESLSRYRRLDECRNPRFEDRAAGLEARMAEDRPWRDPRLDGELPDVYISMGRTAELVAGLTGTSRMEQDEFALASHEKAESAQRNGCFDGELIAIAPRSDRPVQRDEGIRPESTIAGLAGLSPAFVEGGTVTAGNACPLSDGASAAILMSHGEARARGLQPRARIIATAVSALSPEIMGLGPIEASRKCLARAGLSMKDIDVVELNEAFAAQAVPCIKELEIPMSKVNPFGGAIALGHPFGATGVRLVASALNALERTDGRYGLATLCIGGGQGMAVVIERAA